MAHFSPQSRGVTLGFVMFYMNCIIIPGVFSCAFLKINKSLFMIGAINIYMFYLWYSYHPLRVILMCFACLMGYGVVLFLLLLSRRKAKGSTRQIQPPT
ncbi:hypothetical protein CHU32_16655 [Superficieibacter electus]|uniref:Uncharacterized protein n=1 Tax=Superficieibacter electus TaxID=2022662 RepID=A0A2P5GMC0_9ENTR|nr:hypothetical protein CHU32_16655 [Superficieibacter electus]